MDRFLVPWLCGAALLTAPILGFYLFSPKVTGKRKPLLKGLCSLLFLILGGIALFRSSLSLSPFLLFAGLFFSFLGDVILDLDTEKGFLMGLGAFALAHLAFAAGFFTATLTRAAGEGLFPEGPLLFAAAALLMILLFPLLKLRPPKELRIPVAVYLALLALTLSLSVPASRAALSPLPLIGSALFAFSDASLAAGLFGKPSRTASILCLFTYYPAELLLAVSVALF